ncbi:Proteasome subunit alpha type-3 [Mucor velutinosus]|uniref:Protection of telomeres protein 1 n=1 Tax=Mucor velutinosus TaxID=708070 RepID=A0AAN7I2V0_9FUNG|nr:Proteasome subunit alpha type-3 [Mucor velutinosus]
MLDDLSTIYQHTLKKYSWKCLQDYARVKEHKKEQVECTLFLAIDVKSTRTGSDPMYKLLVIDPTLNPDDSYTCNFFVHDENMPEIKKGSIVLLKNAFVQEYRRKPQLTKNRYTEFALFDDESGNCFTSKGFCWKAGDQEIYAAFRNWSQALKLQNGFSANSHSTVPRGRQIVTTAQIQEDDAKYFNYVGMIVGFFEAKEHPPQRRVIKLTDYTRNPHPLTRLEDMADDGTLGNITNDMTVSCTLYDKHAECGPFSFGDYVFLDNCTRNTRNEMQLEIRVSFTPGDGEHVKKLDMDDPRLQPLLQRKREHEASLYQSPSQISETAVNLMRSRIPSQQTLVPIKQLLEKEEPGVEYIRVTIEKQKPSELTTWLKSYCSHCKITSVPTRFEEPDACSRCGNMMKPVYRAMFKVRDDSGSELAVLVMDEQADKLFKDLPAPRLKKNPALWGEFKKYGDYTQEDSKGQKPYFSLGVKKYYNNNSYYQDGWMYSIVNTEFILEDSSQEMMYQ